MTSHDIHTLAGAYALHALPADEQRFFEAHLDNCEACRAEVDELRITAAAVGAAAAEPAPAALRASVLDAIDVTRQDPAPGGVAARERRGRRLAILSVAAAFILVVGGFGVIVSRLADRVSELEAETQRVASILTADDARTIPVTGGDHGHLVASPEHGTTVFVGQSLPAVPSDKTLEVWLISDGRAEPAGLFRANADGRALIVVPHDLSGVDAVGVTVEPAGGSAAPTTDPILLAEV